MLATAHGLVLVTDEPVAHRRDRDCAAPDRRRRACGCSAVIFGRAAEELPSPYDGIDFDAAFTLDLRGLFGEAAVRPHLQRVVVQARVRTAESPERLTTVVEVTERRCPVGNLLGDAGVALSTDWVPGAPGA